MVPSFDPKFQFILAWYWYWYWCWYHKSSLSWCNTELPLQLQKCWCQSQWLTREWWLIIKVEKLAPITKCTKISTLYMAHNSVKWEKVLEILIQKKKKYFSTRSMDEFSHLAELPEVGFFQQSSKINLEIAIFNIWVVFIVIEIQCSLPFHWTGVQGQSSPN